MKPSRAALIAEFQQLVNEMQASQAAFCTAHAKATALFDQFKANTPEAEPQEENVLGVADPLDPKGESEKLLETEFSKPAGRPDHYVEQPFLDPYDCFDDSAPEFGFPFSDRLGGTGPLSGLFESDPQIEIAPTSARDVEIEYLPNGGYRMRSIPRGKRQDGVAHDPDRLDGLVS